MIVSALVCVLAVLSQGNPKKVVFLGDSVAAKVAPLLRQELQPRGAMVTAVSDAMPNPDGVSERRAVAAGADVVLLEFGTDAAGAKEWHSIRDRFVSDLERLVGKLRESPTHPKVFLCLPPPSALPAEDARTQRLAFEIVPLLKQAARECECPIVDFDSALQNRLDLIDGMEPNAMGAEVLADTVVDAISRGSKTDWRVVFADSEEADEGPARNAIDGDPETYWHTNYSTTAEHYPHEIQVDTGTSRTIGGFSYVPRQDGVNGRVAKYEFYVSVDGKNWGEPVAAGVFPRGGDPSKIYFAKPAIGRYFRFRALSEQQGQIWASVGELDILKLYPKRP